jgi:hypothetical protein
MAALELGLAELSKGDVVSLDELRKELDELRPD